MDILILSSCSASKQYDPVIGAKTIDQESREQLLGRYSDSVALVSEMYTGGEHEYIQKAVTEIQAIANVDWFIISAGFGLLESDTPIPSYDCTFTDIDQVRDRAKWMGYDPDQMMNNETIKAVGRELGIPQAIRDQLKKKYDLVFVALGKTYLLAAEEALSAIPETTTAMAFASKGTREYIGDCQWIPSTETEREQLGTTWMELKGETAPDAGKERR